MQIATPGLMRLGPLVEIPNVLRSFDVDPVAIFSEADVRAELFERSDNFIAFQVLGALLKLCIKRSGCAHFGLLVGSRARAAHLGVVGDLMLNAPNLGTAIMDWASNQHRFVRGSVINLLNQDDLLVMTYRVHESSVPGTDQIVDTAVAVGFSVLRGLTGVTPADVWLPRRVPESPRAYQDVFGRRPRFDVSVGGLSFLRRDLERPVNGADMTERKRLEAVVQNYRALDLPTFPDQVRRQLGARITSGRASKSDVAAALGVHEREMGRRLIKAGATFRGLTNEVRAEVASQLLVNTSLTVAKIAEALHYSDTSAFVKAFEREVGQTPLRWREQSQSSLRWRDESSARRGR